jgi:hypothetical protein
MLMGLAVVYECYVFAILDLLSLCIHLYVSNVAGKLNSTVITICQATPLRPEGSNLVFHSSVGLGNGIWVRQPGFDSRHGPEIFLYSTASRLTLVPTQPPIQCERGIKLPGACG